mgnify:CR=1 FL=1
MAVFPESFLWGAASASYQIEGGVKEGGRGASIWDTFSHIPGKVARDENGDVACDSFHRWADDVAALKAMNLRAYRFSIAWPRILPQGDGPVNPEALPTTTPGGCLAENGNRALHHPLSLGPAPGAGGPGRLAEH